IVGTGYSRFCCDNEPYTYAALQDPEITAVDSINNLVYIADSGNHRIRVVNRTSGLMSTFAGTGVKGYNGDNITAISASLFYPAGVAVDNINNLVYIADTSNSRIRVVNRTSGMISTFAGTGERGYNGDNIAATSASLSCPAGVAVDNINNLVYIAGSDSHRIRVVNRTSGMMSTFAGTGESGYNGDNIAATSASLSYPAGVAVDNINNLVYIADTSNSRIRVVNRTNGMMSTIAGDGGYGLNGDYIRATSTSLRSPTEVAVDNINDLVYIADSYNNRILVVDRTSGLINTVAGTGERGYNGDNVAATNALLSRPRGVSIDNINNLLYIADKENHLIRSVPLSSKVVAPGITCFNVSSTNPSVCSGNGDCVSYNNCVCKKNSYIGEQCENDVTKSAYFFAFNSDSFNKSFVNDGTGPYTVSDDGMDIAIFESQKDFTFQASFNPLFDLPGSQFFVAFKLSDLLSSVLSFRFGLEPYPYSNGRFFSSKIQFDERAQNMVFESFDQVSSVLKIKSSTNYILYISFDKNMTQVTSHITDQKGTILVNTILFLSDRDFVNELLKSKYRVWFGLFQNEKKAERGVKVKAMYYGVSTGSVNNELANKETQNNGSANNAPNFRMIIGIIIASSIGYLLMFK
ncbi:NHL repeat-containing protein, partial [Acrasis kona]